MRWAYHIKYKIKTACFLTGLILIILLGNLSERSSFTRLDKSVTTMMQDRLLPATYLYGISNNLHQKKLIQVNSPELSRQEKIRLIEKHDASIQGLTAKYEGTVLTKEEKKRWLVLKKHLIAYNDLEALNMDTQFAPNENAKLNEQFAVLTSDLDALINIQVGEGNQVQKASTSIINHTTLLSYLESVVLIVLALFTLILLSVSDNAIFGQKQDQALN